MVSPFLKINHEAVGMIKIKTQTFSLEYTKTDTADFSVGVVIVAAGSASRMVGANKILMPLGGMPVIARTIAAFQNHPKVGDIVLVTRDDMVLEFQNITEQYNFFKVSDIVVGGKSREESVKNGFERLKKNDKIKTVLIHDGARPLVSAALIDRVIGGVEEFSAVIPAVPVKDTIKKIAKLGKVEQTVDREKLVNIQTPQGFLASLFESALEKSGEDISAFTDDASIVEAQGVSVYTVLGDYKNIKITTPEDMLIAKAYLEVEE